MDASPPPPSGTDPWAIDGKFAPPEEHADVLVIGGGPAGLAAAIEAARDGKSVVLVDENPVPLGLMGLDVPLFYGQRMNAAVQEEARMVERLVASTPAIEAAFDAGVDVRLGVAAWGAFVNGPALQALPASVVGLTDGKRSWMCGFTRLILATGGRDLVLGFEGADLPGVMGARALHSLLTGYQAFDGKRLVILGSGEQAVAAAHAALDHGVEVLALVEVRTTAQAAPAAIEALLARGVRVLTGATQLRGEGRAEVEGLRVTLGDATREFLACDTIVLAVGVVPAVELPSVLGCASQFRGELGGHVPVTAPDGATSLPGIYCVGDCAGVTSPDATAYRLDWMRTLLACGTADTKVCLCEEVTRAEFLGIQPPRYLGWTSAQQAARNATSLLGDGPFNPDQIKRLTRAGMGPCQGRRCREQIALILALESGSDPAKIPLASYRAPVRPLPLNVLADTAETPEMRDGWDVWFGIRTQWVPYEIIGTAAEDAFLAAGSGGNMHA
jgi:thioredoxin reductase